MQVLSRTTMALSTQQLLLGADQIRELDDVLRSKVRNTNSGVFESETDRCTLVQKVVEIHKKLVKSYERSDAIREVATNLQGLKETLSANAAASAEKAAAANTERLEKEIEKLHERLDNQSDSAAANVKKLVSKLDQLKKELRVHKEKQTCPPPARRSIPATSPRSRPRWPRPR